MKKTTFLILAITAMFAFHACKVTEEQKVSKIAKEFLNDLSAKKYKKAKKLCTDESIANITMLESMSNMSNDNKPKAKVEDITCMINGDKANCSYMEDGEQKTLALVKINNKWLVDMKKETPDMNTNQGPNSQMIQDSIMAVDQAMRKHNNMDQGNNYNGMGNDTVSYFDISLVGMHQVDGNLHMTFKIVNRSEWNVQHFWLETYISSKSGKFIQKNDLMFDGIVNAQMLNNIANVDAELEKNKIELVLPKTKIDDIGEVFLTPVRIQLDPGTNQNMPFDIGINNVARYVLLKNDSSYSIKITF